MATKTEKPISEKDEGELALLRHRAFASGDSEYIVFDEEFHRRRMKKQHELNRKLVFISTILSGSIGIIGVVVGVLVKYWLG